MRKLNKYFVHYSYFATGEGIIDEYAIVLAKNLRLAKESFKEKYHVNDFYDAGMTVYNFDKQREEIIKIIDGIRQQERNYLLADWGLHDLHFKSYFNCS